MTTSSVLTILQLYQEVISAHWMKAAAEELGVDLTGRKFTAELVLWLMIVQRLDGRGTLAQAVSTAIASHWGPLLPAARRRRLSSYTGGYSRARQRMPMPLVTAAAHRLSEQLQQRLQEPEPAVNQPVYLIDGSSNQLPHEPELLRLYPPAENQHGVSHWPVVRIVVLHDARTGLAVAPAWGPMYGPNAVSEQALAEGLLDRMPAGAVLLGDRNFGIFWTAWTATQRGHPVIVRLKKDRAEKLAGKRLRPGSEQSLVWRPSRWDRKAHPDIPAEASVAGRLLVCPLAGFREPLYLFTTVQAPLEKVFQLYGLRWNIETDLRSLKQVVRIDRLAVNSNNMMEKELLAAVAAYNLVRTVLCLAARKAGRHPREFSFTRVLYLVEAFLPALLDDPDSPKARRELNRLIRVAQQCTLPKRRKRRSYLREVWAQGYRYPTRQEEHRRISK